MRTLSQIDPEYGDQVEIVLVAFDLFERESRISDFLEQNGYSWDPLLGEREVFSQYRVIAQSIKVAVDRDRIIAFRGSYGRMSSDA